MILSVNEVAHIASLARLTLSPEEQEMYASQLTSIFGYMELLGEVDTTHVEETLQVTGLVDVFREDVVVEPSNLEAYTNSFSRLKNGYLSVPAVFSHPQE